MTETGPNRVTKSVSDGKINQSCQEKEHSNPQIGLEVFCVDANGKKTYENYPKEKTAPKERKIPGKESKAAHNKGRGVDIGQSEVDDGILSPKSLTIPFMDKNGKIIGRTNEKGDLLINKELTHGRKMIIREKDLWTNAPPKKSVRTQLIPTSDHEIILTPTGVWTDRNFRKLDSDELMELIEKRKEKIGPKSSIDDNLLNLQKRIESV